jgi:site-specific DNA-methyltransferase (adenine-specific)
MTRVEQLADGVCVHLGDMLEILPTLGPVSHVITDPPYEDELHKAIGRIRRNDGQAMIDSLGFEGINETREEAAKAIVAASDGWALVFQPGGGRHGLAGRPTALWCQMGYDPLLDQARRDTAPQRARCGARR